MSRSLPDPHDAALKYWTSARDRLEHTIQNYNGSCEQLGFVLNTSPALTTRYLLDQAFAELDLEIPALLSLEQNLSKSRHSLETLHNSSPGLAPINSLPSEILLSILFLVHEHQDWKTNVNVEVAYDAEANARTLSSVCCLWRQLMLNTPKFWSQILLPLGEYPNRPKHKTAELRVKRSRDSLLDIWISENRTREKIGHSQPSIYHAIQFLTPLFPRVHNLKIHSKDNLAIMIAGQFISSWVNEGTIGTAEGLNILVGDEDERAFDGISLPKHGTNLSPESFISFFTSLRALRLRNAVIDLNSLACTRLEHLHLRYLWGWQLTTSDIAQVLVSNPMLRSLVLDDITFISNLPLTTDPIALDKLEVLTLTMRWPSDLWSVMGLIKSSSDGVQLKISMGADALCVDSLHLFSERCRITDLWLSCETHSDFHISAILTPMPHLQTIHLWNFVMTSNILQDFVRHRSSHPRPLYLWPKLKKIHITTDSPPEIFESHIRSLLLPNQELSISGVPLPSLFE
ncbi:F-box-like protein [Ceratobasidium sp. AG-Ba]|nr:F-box-like protein [Ceratobasidium sp. AG-Ba]